MHTESFIDQTGHRIHLAHPPQTIISLVPSQTELLYHLGLESAVAGITRYCVHPTHWKSRKRIVGGTKNFDFAAIDKLAPDLILGNKEENYREGIETLRQKYPVWLSDILTFPQALEMIRAVGALTGKQPVAEEIIDEINGAFGAIKKIPPQKVLYLIWRKPWMGAGSNTFIHSILEMIGFRNCVRERQRYPELTDDMIRSLKPDVILLSSEPYPFRQKHVDEMKLLSPTSKIYLVDGEMFSWYGSRLRLAPAYFNSLPLATP